MLPETTVKKAPIPTSITQEVLARGATLTGEEKTVNGIRFFFAKKKNEKFAIGMHEKNGRYVTVDE